MTIPPPVQSHKAAPVTVHAGDGSTHPGYLIRTDTVLAVQAGCFASPLHVVLDDGTHHTVSGIHWSTQTDAAGDVLCALLLPRGTAVVDTDSCPPADVMPADFICPEEQRATRSIWCRLFPGIPGC